VTFKRWDDESRLRLVVSLVGLAFGAYVFATTEPRSYLHLPAVCLIVVSVWLLLVAFVPELRGEQGSRRHRLLIVYGSFAVVVLIILVVGRAALPS
jgi:hypothetical protein